MPSFDALLYEDAKRPVNDDLLNGVIADPEIEEEVQRFIDANHCVKTRRIRLPSSSASTKAAASCASRCRSRN